MSTTHTVKSTKKISGRISKSAEHPYNLQCALEHFERGYLQNVLVLANWNITRAARMLGIRAKTLEAKMRKYEIFAEGRK